MGRCNEIHSRWLLVGALGAAGLLVGAAESHAAVIASNLGPGDSYDESTVRRTGALTTDQGERVVTIASPFTSPGLYSVDSVDLPLYQFDSDGDNVRFSIHQDASGAPGLVLGYVDGLISTVDDAIVNIDFSGADIELSADVYWLSLEHLDAVPGNDEYGFWPLNDTGATGAGTLYGHLDAWIVSDAASGAFRVNGTPVPEPAASALLALGAVGLLRRRRT